MTSVWRGRALGAARVLADTAGADRRLAQQALHTLRGACVGCHQALHGDSLQSDSYPMVRNTVRGLVRVFAKDGKERTTRQDVLVFLDGDLPQEADGTPRLPGRISQTETSFVPRLLPVLIGADVAFPNDDIIYHNVFSLSETQPFDLGRFGPGKSSSVRFERAGLVRVHCNMHPHMAATIVVLRNRWFAQTDAEGNYALTDVPDGTWQLRTWHELGGELRETITVKGNGLQLDLTVKEDRTVVPHRNKFGQPYRQKY